MLLALDTDTIVVGDISCYADADAVAIKPENRDPYPPQCWRELFAVLGIPEPSRSAVMTSTAQVTYPYYNSGVIAVPRDRCDQLRESWTKRIFDVLDLYESRPDIVPAKERHWTNQLSLALAVAGDGIPVVRLPVAANLSTTVTVHPLFAHEVTPPFVLHYHNEMDAAGFVYRSRNRALNPLIDAFNRQRAELGGARLRGLAGPAAGPAAAPLGRGPRLVRAGAGRPRPSSPPAGAGPAPRQAIGPGLRRPMTGPMTGPINVGTATAAGRTVRRSRSSSAADGRGRRCCGRCSTPTATSPSPTRWRSSSATRDRTTRCSTAGRAASTPPGAPT